MVTADAPPARREDPTAPPSTPRPPGVPLGPRVQPIGPRIADETAAASRAARLRIFGYRVRPSIAGPRLWVMRQGSPEILLRDLTFTRRHRLIHEPATTLAEAILVHWLDREPPLTLVDLFRDRFLPSVTGREFTIRAADIKTFLAALGVTE